MQNVLSDEISSPQEGHCFTRLFPHFLQNLLSGALISPQEQRTPFTVLSSRPSLTAEAISRIAGEISRPVSLITGTDSFLRNGNSPLKGEHCNHYSDHRQGKPDKEAPKLGRHSVAIALKKSIKPMAAKIKPVTIQMIPTIFRPFSSHYACVPPPRGGGLVRSYFPPPH